MKKLKADMLYFTIERDTNKYADQYVNVVIYTANRKSALHINLLAILSDRVKLETNRGLFLYGLYEDSAIIDGKPQIIGVDMV